MSPDTVLGPPGLRFRVAKVFLHSTSAVNPCGHCRVLVAPLDAGWGAQAVVPEGYRYKVGSEPATGHLIWLDVGWVQWNGQAGEQGWTAPICLRAPLEGVRAEILLGRYIGAKARDPLKAAIGHEHRREVMLRMMEMQDLRGLLLFHSLLRKYHLCLQAMSSVASHISTATDRAGLLRHRWRRLRQVQWRTYAKIRPSLCKHDKVHVGSPPSWESLDLDWLQED
jgi:hypothetical protein